MWTPVAKDGAPLPAAESVAVPARQTIAVGETYEFEYQAPRRPQDRVAGSAHHRREVAGAGPRHHQVGSMQAPTLKALLTLLLTVGILVPTPARAARTPRPRNPCRIRRSSLERCSNARDLARSGSCAPSCSSARPHRKDGTTARRERVNADACFALRFVTVVFRAHISRPGPLGTWAAFLVLAIAPVVLGARAEPLASIPNPRVQNGTWVTDMAGALRADTVSRLNDTIGAFERATGVEMAVVVIRSLDGSSIEEAAAKLFGLWGIGKKDRDNGLLLLWSTGDRRVRVEVGYGLEGILPDGKVGAILDAYVIPRFRSGEFDEGIVAGVDAILAAARNEDVELPAQASESYDGDSDGSLPSWLPFVGSIPVGLGSFVGFRRWRRYRRRHCPQCHTRMVLLPESEDDALLQEGQVAEERIGSVDYDVWNCPACSHHFTLRYAKWVSKYEKCPQCSNRTKSSTEHVISAATTSSSGSARVVETCAFCSFTHEYTKVLPQITQSSSSSSSSGGSSSSSFGGGSSGGGGASRGYSYRPRRHRSDYRLRRRSRGLESRSPADNSGPHGDAAAALRQRRP